MEGGGGTHSRASSSIARCTLSGPPRPDCPALSTRGVLITEFDAASGAPAPDTPALGARARIPPALGFALTPVDDELRPGVAGRPPPPPKSEITGEDPDVDGDAARGTVPSSMPTPAPSRDSGGMPLRSLRSLRDPFRDAGDAMLLFILLKLRGVGDPRMRSCADTECTGLRTSFATTTMDSCSGVGCRWSHT